jgi:hypothetical protein
MKLAASGGLRDRQALDAQVSRMLADPRASAFAENFAGQWLETRNLDGVKPDPDLFKEWDADLRDAMKRETAMFFEYVLRENRPVSDFLTADYTFLNQRLATHYGIAGVAGPEMRRVTLQTDRRGGVLSQGAVLTVSSYPTRTSPVIRGKYVLQNILGTPPEPPPGDIPPLEESAAGGGLSVREQLERHRANPTCAACHRIFEPVGIALENFDAVGTWRTREDGIPIDASGQLVDGTKVSGVVDLRNSLVRYSDQFTRVVAEKLLTYALGRGVEEEDMPLVRSIVRQSAGSKYRFSSLALGIVKSPVFQMNMKPTPRAEQHASR